MAFVVKCVGCINLQIRCESVERLIQILFYSLVILVQHLLVQSSQMDGHINMVTAQNHTAAEDFMQGARTTPDLL